MLYKKDQVLKKNVFNNPTAEYRGAPFWAWNCNITKELIDEQIHYFKEMGMGGFHIHVRVGLENEYLSDEFLELVKYTNQKAKEHGMLCWLYDEDRYSSGYAGGLVTKDRRFRARHARFSVENRTEFEENKAIFDQCIERNLEAIGYFICAFDIVLEEGYLKSYRRVTREEEQIVGQKWYLYLELENETPWCNNQTYVDTLNADATWKFIETTHEKYYEIIGEDFGKSVPAIFTDEPEFHTFETLNFAEDTRDVCIPYTDDIPETYRRTYGEDLLDVFPEVVWEKAIGEYSLPRYRYHDHVCNRFVEGCLDVVGKWCEEHNIYYTGHVQAEQELESQTARVGEAMRCYRSFQLPGIDMLCDNREFATAKQAQSAVHQFGREGMISELYGVTQWDFDFKGHKLAGDWQAALGVTTRVHHLAWASMKGEAKRDYPAAIGYQSPWYKEYTYIEDHFSRLNSVLTRGKPIVKVGVIHPIETMWLYYGPKDQTIMDREGLEYDFRNLTEWLLTGMIDYDYISESLLPTLTPEQIGFPFIVGAMEYQVILVPSCINLRSTTLVRLMNFKKAGGQVIIYGMKPTHIDVKESQEVKEFVDGCMNIPTNRSSLLKALKPYRTVDVRTEEGRLTDKYIYQLREDNGVKWLFICNAFNGTNVRGEVHYWNRKHPLHEAEKLNININGVYRIQKYDTLDGSVSDVNVLIDGNVSVVHYDMYGNDSVLFRLSDKEDSLEYIAETMVEKEIFEQPVFVKEELKIPQLLKSVRINLDEPNVLLLDRFEYALDTEEYQSEDELLRVDNIIRKRLNFHQRSESVAQPYITKEIDTKEHILHLRYQFNSKIEISGCKLALEELSFMTISFNQQIVAPISDGFFVDRAIQTIELPTIVNGMNELIIDLQFGSSTNLEWMYILGDFGVQVNGINKSLIQKPTHINFGDFVHQGLPFYVGNVSYQFEIETNESQLELSIPYYSGSLLTVTVNDKKLGVIAFLPNRITLNSLHKGANTVNITCYGNRYNGFGQLHMIGDDLNWVGPDSWRTKGNSWSDEYQFKPMGILTRPQFFMLKEG